MELKKLLAGHLFVLTLVLPYTVAAEDFTLNVGVNFTNLHPDITSIGIRCGAVNEKSTDTIGDIIKDINIPANGAINQTVQVKFNADSGKNPADATNYKCDVLLRKQSIGSGPIPGTDSNCDNPNNEWRCAKVGTRFVRALSGKISGGSAGNSRAIKTKSGIVMGFEDK